MRLNPLRNELLETVPAADHERGPELLVGLLDDLGEPADHPNGQELNGSGCLLGAHLVGPRMDPHGR